MEPAKRTVYTVVETGYTARIPEYFNPTDVKNLISAADPRFEILCTHDDLWNKGTPPLCVFQKDFSDDELELVEKVIKTSGYTILRSHEQVVKEEAAKMHDAALDAFFQVFGGPLSFCGFCNRDSMYKDYDLECRFGHVHVYEVDCESG